MAEPAPVTILLVDDHRIIREGLRALLRTDPAFEVVGEAENGREAVRLARALAPDVVIMDVTMPDLNGIDATLRVKGDRPETRVIALSVHTDPSFADEMLKAGAEGYVVKSSAFDNLAEAIRRVMAGQIYLSPGLADAAVGAYLARQPERGSPPRLSLTPREREVLQLLAEGYGAKEAAAHLHISPSTVDSHRAHVMQKLGVGSMAELTKYAVRAGLTDLEP